MVNHGHLLQAVISKRFRAQTRGFHHWIELKEYHNLHMKLLKIDYEMEIRLKKLHDAQIPLLKYSRKIIIIFHKL